MILIHFQYFWLVILNQGCYLQKREKMEIMKELLWKLNKESYVLYDMCFRVSIYACEDNIAFV